MSPNAPDYAEPIVGWRLWHVAERDGEIRLLSPLYRTPWPKRTELVAGCRRGLEAAPSLYRPRRSRHGSPDPSCGCGVYASRSPIDAAAYMSKFFKSGDDVIHRVMGTVSLWGTVIECERGWRSSHAYPQRIFVPVPVRRRLLTVGALRRPALPAGEIATALGDYGVPVELVAGATLADLAAALESFPARLAEAA